MIVIYRLGDYLSMNCFVPALQIRRQSLQIIQHLLASLKRVCGYLQFIHEIFLTSFLKE